MQQKQRLMKIQNENFQRLLQNLNEDYMRKRKRIPSWQIKSSNIIKTKRNTSKSIQCWKIRWWVKRQIRL